MRDGGWGEEKSFHLIKVRANLHIGGYYISSHCKQRVRKSTLESRIIVRQGFKYVAVKDMTWHAFDLFSIAMLVFKCRILLEVGIKKQNNVDRV